MSRDNSVLEKAGLGLDPQEPAVFLYYAGSADISTHLTADDQGPVSDRSVPESFENEGLALDVIKPDPRIIVDNYYIVRYPCRWIAV